MTTVRTNQDFFTGLGFLALAAGMYAMSFSIKQITAMDIGPSFMPKLVTGCIAICSLALIYQSQQGEAAAKNGEKKESGSANWGFIKIVSLICLYFILLEPVGYLIMTTVYLFGHFMLLSTAANRKIPLFVLVSIAVSTGTYYLFREVFFLLLPAGILG